MNEPVDSGNIFLKLNWGILDRILRRANGLGRVFGAMMYPLEIALTGVVRESPATEIMICRKAGGGDR